MIADFDTDLYSRIRLVKGGVCVALVVAVLMSMGLWLSVRTYPFLPISDALPPLRHPFDAVVLTEMLVALVMAALVAKPRGFLIMALIFALLLAAEDQTRWQPWFYQYLLMMGALAIFSWRRDDFEGSTRALLSCRLIVASIYFWSGFHKLNLSFLDALFPMMIRPFVGRPTGTFGAIVHVAGVVPPFVEMAIGISLFTIRWRKIAVAMVLMMHSFILLSLGPLGNNTNAIVWPWNVAMMTFVPLLFWLSDNIPATGVVAGRNSYYHRLLIVLCLVMPPFCMFNLWDSLLSSTLYSGNKRTGRIFVSDDLATKLPPHLAFYLSEASDPSGEHQFRIDDWSERDMNIPVYPEVRIYKRILKTVCDYSPTHSGARLESDERLFWHMKFRYYLGLEPSQKTVHYNCEDV